RVHVVDDTVVNYRDGLVPVPMRMAVCLRHAAVRGPTCVPDAHRSWQSFRSRVLKCAQVANLAGQPQTFTRDGNYTRRVIPPILQPLATTDDDVPRLFVPDITHDSAHCVSPFEGAAPSSQP